MIYLFIYVYIYISIYIYLCMYQGRIKSGRFGSAAVGIKVGNKVGLGTESVGSGTRSDLHRSGRNRSSFFAIAELLGARCVG